MSRTVTINVTQEDIDNGKRRTAYGCPVWLALSRVFPGKSIATDSHSGSIGFWYFDTPRAVSAFINMFDAGDFDAGDSVSPFSFELEGVPDDLAEHAVIQDLHTPMPLPEPAKKESHMRLGDLRAILTTGGGDDDMTVIVQGPSGSLFRIEDVLVSYMNNKMVLVIDS